MVAIQKLQIFSKNKSVTYNGTCYIVEHVVLKQGTLYVKLEGLSVPVIATDIQCEFTEFELKRK